MEDNKIIEELAVHDTEIKSLKRRVTVCEETAKSINALTQCIAKMDVTLETTNDTVKELKDDVHDLKEKPAKKWDSLATTIIAAIASGLIGYIISTVL